MRTGGHVSRTRRGRQRFQARGEVDEPGVKHDDDGSVTMPLVTVAPGAHSLMIMAASASLRRCFLVMVMVESRPAALIDHSPTRYGHWTMSEVASEGLEVKNIVSI